MKTKKLLIPRRPNSKQAELRAFIALCFFLIDETDTKEICNRIGLSKTTVYRFINGDFSIAAQFGTIQAFGDAAGLRLIRNENEYRVELKKEPRARKFIHS